MFALALLAATLCVEGPTLQLPWPCGTTERCTQGHNNGSHTGSSAWAWDFALQEGEEIWAASAGTVTHLRKNSTVGGCNSAYIADANFVTIDHGDGTSIVYAHMQTGSIPLEVGDVVEVGDLIGKAGETGYACGAHLHMAVQDQCGSSHCQSVQAAFADIGDPAASTSYESANCPVCPRVLDGGTTVVDERDAGCVERVTTSWWSSMEGHDAHHWYTFRTEEATSVSSATWHARVEVAGDYLVEVFVPEEDADTADARYLVHHDDGSTEVVVSQLDAKGWQALGTFAFSTPDGPRVELGDATADAEVTRIAFDAVRFTYVPSAGDESGGSSTGTPEEETSTGEPAASTSTTTDEPATSTGPAHTEDTGDATGLPPGFGDRGDGTGCACRSHAPGSSPLLLYVAFALVRRRRRNANTPASSSKP